MRDNQNKPIRILHVLGALDRGGAETMVMNLYRNIDRSKIQFDFLIHTTKMCDYTKEIESLGGKIYSISRFQGYNFIQYIKELNHFFQIHPEYLIIHGHVRSTASIYLFIAKKYNRITIVHSHSTSNGKGYKALIKSILQFSIRFQANYFFSCSNEAGRWLFGNKIVKSNKYYIIPNAIDINSYTQNTSIRDSYRKKFGIEDKKVFINIGRLHSSKNHDFLLEIFSGLIKKQPNSVLFIVGNGELEKNINRKIDELNLNREVRMLGVRSDIPNLLQAADCLLFPSKWEGLPVTVIEAQAAGLPCIISDHITKNVKLSNLVVYLPIDKGIDIWIDKIENIDFQRKDVTSEIKKAGFDIKSTSKWVENFYIKRIESKN